MSTKPDYGEPWVIDENLPYWWQALDRNGETAFDDGSAGGEYGPECSREAGDRIIACVNACAGMADPAAEIAELKRERDEAREIIATVTDQLVRDQNASRESAAELAAMRAAIKDAAAHLAQTPDAYDSRFFRAGRWADAALAKLQPFLPTE